MDGERNGLTLESLAKRLETQGQRLEALERENADLRSKVTTLEGSGTPRDDEEPAPALDGRVSRRRLLSKAGAAAAGLVVAGALTQRDIREAKATNHVVGTSTASDVPAVKGTNTGGGTAMQGDCGDNGSASRGAVEGSNNSTSGYGVWGNSAFVGVKGDGNFTGVRGESPSTYGVHGTGAGAGVVGDCSESGGIGVWGFSNVNNGFGVIGESGSSSGYGGMFKGGKAQLKLVPASTRGRPSGAHTKGEIYMDSAGALFVCTKGGNPATWRKVSTTAV